MASRNLDLDRQGELLLAAVLFILGIKRMASPVTARKGIVQAGIGMVLATAGHLCHHRHAQHRA
jgi:NAD/NADP transhydrogenase beta subunit